MTRTLVNRLALAFVFIALVYGLYAFPFAEWIAVIVAWAHGHPVAGPTTYVIAVIIATVMFVPGSGSMMIAGFLFGVAPGVLYAMLGIALGAQCAFLTGRKGARRWIEKKVQDNVRLKAIEKGLREEAFLIVVLTRLSIIIPFNVLNYAYGITSVRATTHFVATTVGMFPAVVLYVYLGTLARDLGQILSGEGTPPDLGYWIAAAGIVAIVVLTWVIHRTASRALERHLPTTDTNDTK